MLRKVAEKAYRAQRHMARKLFFVAALKSHLDQNWFIIKNRTNLK